MYVVVFGINSGGQEPLEFPNPTSQQCERKKACPKPELEFPKMGVPYFGVLKIRILLFRVLFWDPLIFGNSQFAPSPVDRRFL